MIAIDNIETVSLPKQRRKPRLTERAKKTIRRYNEAYKAVYGVLPEITFDGAYYRIKGQTLGVKLMRLKEMARQLEYRAGV